MQQTLIYPTTITTSATTTITTLATITITSTTITITTQNNNKIQSTINPIIIINTILIINNKPLPHLHKKAYHK